MKHLLILISFLLLSSPVIGNNHKGETLYLWKTSSGEVWKGFGDKDTNPKYQGEVENGVPNGLGYLIYPDGGKYVGSWKDGNRNGQGTETFPDGSKYVGSWKDGNRNGQGTETFPDGGKYVGSWKDGNRNGQGTITYSNMKKFVGEFKGFLWNGNLYDQDGNIDYKIVNGEYIEQ